MDIPPKAEIFTWSPPPIITYIFIAGLIAMFAFCIIHAYRMYRSIGA